MTSIQSRLALPLQDQSRDGNNINLELKIVAGGDEPQRTLIRELKYCNEKELKQKCPKIKPGRAHPRRNLAAT